MTQRVTIAGEVWELIEPSSSEINTDDRGALFMFRKIEPPKEKESQKLWGSLRRDYPGQLDDTNVYAPTERFYSKYADYILARVREELPEMMEALADKERSELRGCGK